MQLVDYVRLLEVQRPSLPLLCHVVATRALTVASHLCCSWQRLRSSFWRLQFQWAIWWTRWFLRRQQTCWTRTRLWQCLPSLICSHSRNMPRNSTCASRVRSAFGRRFYGSSCESQRVSVTLFRCVVFGHHQWITLSGINSGSINLNQARIASAFTSRTSIIREH